MNSYLMMLYVTLEQESALKTFFLDQGWLFCKPDLSVTTDKLGPVVSKPHVLGDETIPPVTDIPTKTKQTFPKIEINISSSDSDTETTQPKRRGKRKTKATKQNEIRVKQARIIPSTSLPEPNESNENAETHTVTVDSIENEATSAFKTPITVQVEDGNEFTIKIEKESNDSDIEKGEVDKSNVIGDDNFEDDGDDDDELTDPDYSYEEASSSAVNTSVKVESQSDVGNLVSIDKTTESGSTDKMELPDRSFDLKEEVKTSIIKDTAEMPAGPTSQALYECDVCWYTTYKKFNYRRHRQTHIKGDNDPFKPASTSTQIKDRKQHVCDQCGKMFKSSCGLQLHKKNKHLKEYAHICDVCGKGYNQKVQFKFHMASHVNISLTECCFCEKTFKGHSSLKRHKLICSSNPERTHIDENNEFICNKCCKSFKTNERLEYHKKGKHGPKNYSCPKCGNKYSWRSSLKVHRMNCK